MRLSAILLAAGRSTRFKGPPKLAVPFQEGPSLLERQIALLSQLPVTEKVVVLNSSISAMASLLVTQNPTVKALINPHPELGLHSSIRCAVEIDSDIDGWILWLADLHQLQLSHFDKLLQEIDRCQGKLLIAPSFQSIRGHPVFIPQNFKKRILQEPDGDYGCRYLWREAASDQHIELPWGDSAVLADFDS